MAGKKEKQPLIVSELTPCLRPDPEVVDECKKLSSDEWELARREAFSSLSVKHRAILIDLLMMLNDPSSGITIQSIGRDVGMTQQGIYVLLRNGGKFKRAYTLSLMGSDFTEEEIRVTLRKIIGKAMNDETLNLNAAVNGTKLMMMAKGMFDGQGNQRSIALTVIDNSTKNIIMENMRKPKFIEADVAKQTEED